MDQYIAIDNTPLRWSYKDQIFIPDRDYDVNNIEYWFGDRSDSNYIKSHVALFAKLAITNYNCTENQIKNIVGGDINKIKVNIPILKKLAEYFLKCGIHNWNYGYWFDESIRNFNIFNFNMNNLSILCNKKDISLQGLYNNPGFKPGFKERNICSNQSVEDINMINLLFNNTKNPKFIIGIGNYDDSRIIDDSSTYKSTTISKKQPLYVKDPDNYVKNDIDPKFLNKLITTSGWSAINLQDMISMKKGDINIYNITSGGNVRSIPKQVYTNLCYYLRVSKEFLNESTKSNIKTKIPSYAKYSVDNCWIMKQNWKSISSDITNDLSKAVQIPTWFFGNIDYNTVYVSERIKNIIMRWLNKNYKNKYDVNDLFIYDEKKDRNKMENISISDITEKVVVVEKKSFMDRYNETFNAPTKEKHILEKLEEYDNDQLNTIIIFCKALIENRNSAEIIKTAKEAADL